MSMLPMDFSYVLDSFSQPVLVTDTTGAHVNGVWVEDGPGTTRTVSAIVLAMSFEELQFYAEGDSSAAGITLTTDEELFFTDINAEGWNGANPTSSTAATVSASPGQGSCKRTPCTTSTPASGTSNERAFGKNADRGCGQHAAGGLPDLRFPMGGRRVVVETQAGPRPPSGVYATLWWKAGTASTGGG